MAKVVKKGSRRGGGSAAAAAAGPAAGSATLSRVSIEDLAAEMARRQRGVSKLRAQRERLVARVQEIDREIMALGGAVGGRVATAGGVTAAGRPRKRPQNEKNLADMMVDVLRGKTMGVSELAEAVVAAGYQTTASSFRTIVNQTLLRDERFSKVERGQYTVK